MRVHPRAHNPFRSLLVALIRSTAVDADTIRRAYDGLAPTDRDCLPWVPRLLALEG
jgi:hypothetical protein